MGITVLINLPQTFSPKIIEMSNWNYMILPVSFNCDIHLKPGEWVSSRKLYDLRS